MNQKKILFTLVLAGIINFSSYCQDDDIFGITRKAKNPKSESGTGNAVRNMLEMISLEVSGGGGYSHFTSNFYTERPLLYPLSQFQNFDNSTFSSSDTLKLVGSGFLPLLNTGVRVNLFNLLTIGGGIGAERITNLSPLQGNNFEFDFIIPSYDMIKTYGTLGLIVYDAKRRQSFLKWRYRNYSSSNLYMQSQLKQRIKQNYPWRFMVEGEFGNLKLVNQKLPVLKSEAYYDPKDFPQGYFDFFELDDSKYVPKFPGIKNPYYGLSLRIEYDLSDYAKVFVKGGAELRKFTYTSSDFSEFQNVDQTIFGLQTGVAMKFPGTKRCKIQGCGVVMKHLHNGVEYRGSSIFQLQNRKIGQWY